MDQSNSKKLGFIGSGNIVQAILGGFLKAGNVKPLQVKTSAPSDRNFGKMQELGVVTTHSNPEVTTFGDVLFLGCKPYHVEDVAKEVSPNIDTDRHLVVSCAAGLSMEYLEKNFPTNTRLITIIPNMACLVREGGVVLVSGTHATRADVDTVRGLFKNVAQCFEVPERLVNPGSAVLGCGVAFMSLIAEGLADGGVMVGLPRRDAVQMTAQLFIGVGKLLQESGENPAHWKDSCCSPNGSSICGIHALEQSGVRAGMMNAVQAATDRGNAMQPK